MPDPFPFSSVAANRAFYWLDSQDPAKARDLAFAVYGAAFGGRDISRPEGVAAVAETLGLDPNAVLAGSQSPEAKDRTRVENDAAIEKGVFGSPFFIVDGEPFHGADRLDQLDRWLKTGGW
jgi:2-hydroxychromene-2-carboxylate isomerase